MITQFSDVADFNRSYSAISLENKKIEVGEELKVYLPSLMVDIIKNKKISNSPLNRNIFLNNNNCKIKLSKGGVIKEQSFLTAILDHPIEINYSSNHVLKKDDHLDATFLNGKTSKLRISPIK
jgi:hypothetical protein